MSASWLTFKTKINYALVNSIKRLNTLSLFFAAATKPIYLSPDIRCLLFKLAKVIRQTEMKPYYRSCQVSTPKRTA